MSEEHSMYQGKYDAIQVNAFYENLKKLGWSREVSIQLTLQYVSGLIKEGKK